MHSDAAKPHHIFHPRQQQCFQPATTMKQFENIASVFRDAKAFPSDQMLAHVESGHAGTLNIENSSILARDVSSERTGFFFVFISCS